MKIGNNIEITKHFVLIKLGRKYVLELSGLSKFNTEHGISTDFCLTYDSKRNDHAPGMYFHLAIFGWMLFDFTLHNRNHATDPRPINICQKIQYKKCNEFEYLTDEEIEKIFECE